MFHIQTDEAFDQATGDRVSFLRRGRGPAVLLIHGGLCDASFWSEQLEPLAHHHQVFALDLPGHGGSTFPAGGGYSLDLVSESIEALREHVRVESWTLVGHSFGAQVALRYAQLYPGRADAVVMVDGTVFPPELREQFDPGTASPEAAIRGMFSPFTPTEVKEHVLATMLRAPASTSRAVLAAMSDPRRPSSDRLKVRGAGIYAEHQMLPGIETALQYTRGLFADFSQFELAGTGHFLMLEKPAEFTALLEHCLSG